MLCRVKIDEMRGKTKRKKMNLTEESENGRLGLCRNECSTEQWLREEGRMML